jgi:hypothetical protein
MAQHLISNLSQMYEAGGCGIAFIGANAQYPMGRNPRRACENGRSVLARTELRYVERKGSLHLRSRLYDLPTFKAGALSLRSHEIADLGDVRHRQFLQGDAGAGLSLVGADAP